MNDNEDFTKEIEIKEEEQSNLMDLYGKLSKAISSNNTQSIWELSKTITRCHFKEIHS